MTVNWGYISPRLREDGFCPWALDLPDRGQAQAAESAAAVARFVREVRQATGARKISILGHSLGDADHFMMAADDVVYQWTRHTLCRRGPARPAWGVDR